MKYITILLFCATFYHIDGQRITDFASIFSKDTSVQDIIEIFEGLAEYAPNFIPTREDIKQLGNQLIFGYPLVFPSSVFNFLCATALTEDTIHPLITPDINELKFELITPCARQSYPILEAEKLWNSPEFKRDQKVVIYSSGYGTNTTSKDVETMSKAYNCRGEENFVVLDTNRSIDTLYTWSALNTDEIGRYVAIALQRLDEVIPIENVHLIGHSLGAQIVGATGRHFSELTGKKLKHITGLDPAKPCFKEGQALPGIQPDVAEFVDIIHSNPGVAGVPSDLGHADFYPGGKKPSQKGCKAFLCSHERAWRYYAESVYPGNENNFPSVRCTSLFALESGSCKGDSIPMGYAVPFSASGNYFADVNKSEPYGLNAPENATLSTSECGSCE